MDSMAQKSQMEVPTEFLNTIREEKHENKQPATSTIEPQITKKYPFNRYITNSEFCSWKYLFRNQIELPKWVFEKGKNFAARWRVTQLNSKKLF